MKNRYIETHQTWNSIAQLYANHFMDLELYNDTYKTFCDSLNRTDATVLELGCGPGNITQYLLKRNSNLKILATDISTNMIALAKKNNPNIDTQVLNCKNINILKGKYDGIVCGFTIPYLSKKDCMNLLSDSAKLLNDKGIFYLSFVAGPYKKSGFISGSSGDRVYFYYHELKMILKQLELTKMEVVSHIEKEYKKANHTIEKHTILIARKA